INSQLSVSSCALFQNAVYIFYMMAASQMIQNRIYKVEQFVNQSTGIYFLFLAKINQSAIQSIAAGAPFVFVNQCTRILNKVQVFATQHVDTGAYGLKQCGNGNGFIHCHGNIAYSE